MTGRVTLRLQKKLSRVFTYFFELFRTYVYSILLAEHELTGYGTGLTVLATKLETYYRRQIETSTTLMDKEVRVMRRCHCQTLYSGFKLSLLELRL